MDIVPVPKPLLFKGPLVIWGTVLEVLCLLVPLCFHIIYHEQPKWGAKESAPRQQDTVHSTRLGWSHFPRGACGCVALSLCFCCRRHEEQRGCGAQGPSVTDAELVEARRCSLPDPAEELGQLVEEGQGGRGSWIKPHHQETEDQGSQEALFEGQRKEVAHCRVPKLANQHR